MTDPSTQTILSEPHEKIMCDGYLWSFMQGELDPAEALLVATHCNLSCEARKRLKALATCAATALETIEPVTMSCSAQAFFAEKCVGKKEAELPTIECLCEVPKALQPFVGTLYDDVKWQDVYPGIQEKRIKVDGSSLDMRVVKISKGTTVPAHSHNGDEFTLVLKGAFMDGDRHYQKGDLSIQKSASDTTHSPKATEDCICLTVTHAPIRLQGFLGRILRPFQSLRS